MKKSKLLSFSVAAVSIIFFFGACQSKDSAEGSYQSANVYKQALFGELATKSMEYQGPARNPVIFVHGFLGARLQYKRTHECIWGQLTGRQLMNGYSKSYLRKLAYPMELGKPLSELPDNLEAVRLLKNMDVKIMAMDFKMTAYQSIIDLLHKGGYVSDSMPLPKDKKFYSLFCFYYDWRDDIAENSRRLHHFILKRKKYMQRKYKEIYGIEDFDVQFDVIGHSMGGLVTRYYLRYGEQQLVPDGKLPELDWRGSKHVDKAIIVGTPNAGYLDTCLEMTQGLQLEPGVPVYPPAVIGTFQSYYQMMPVSGMRAVILDDKPGKPEVDIYDPEVWISRKWGLADPKQDDVLQAILPKVKSAERRREIAIDHLRKCLKKAKQFTEAMRIDSKPPEDVMLILFSGDAVKTSRCATVEPKTNKLKVIKTAPGDGKVLSCSARFDERAVTGWTPFATYPIKWQAVINVQGAHMGIMDNYSFIDNLAFYLLAFPTAKRHAAYEKWKQWKEKESTEK